MPIEIQITYILRSAQEHLCRKQSTRIKIAAYRIEKIIACEGASGVMGSNVGISISVTAPAASPRDRCSIQGGKLGNTSTRPISTPGVLSVTVSKS